MIPKARTRRRPGVPAQVIPVRMGKRWMGTIQSTVSRSSEAFRQNDRRYRELLDDLRVRRRAAIESGTASTRARHVEGGKLLPRDRVRALLDLGSPFLEVAALAGGGTSGAAPLGAGIITGIGVVAG